MQQKSFSDRLSEILGILFRVVQWVYRQVWGLISRLLSGRGATSQSDAASASTSASSAGASASLGDRARQMAADASEKGRAIVDDVKHRAEDLMPQNEQADQMSSSSGQVTTDAGIPLTSREGMLSGEPRPYPGDSPEERAAAERAAGGVISDRPGEMGISRRTETQDESAFAFTGSQGTPIAESMHETTAPSAVDNESESVDTAPGEEAVADAIQSSVSDSDVDQAVYMDTPELTNIARDQPNETLERASQDLRESELSDIEADETADEDQGPWEASSPSDMDFPAASRGARVYGEESDIAGLAAEEGYGFGRDEDELLTTGGEIDLENDEAPSMEASEAPDIVSLDEADEEGEVAFGGEDTTLVADTLGLRESEEEPVRAGRNDDVSMHLATGGPEEESRESDLSKPEEDVTKEGDDVSSDNLGISGDYDKAERVEKIPAVPEDEEAGKGGSTGSGPEATPPSAGQSASGATRAGREVRVPEGAVSGDGSPSCPEDHPIKGNASSRIYHMPGQSSYDATVPEFCFATEEAAEAAGFRARKR